MATMIETQKRVEISPMVSVVKNLSASHKIKMFITILKRPKVIQTRGVDTNLSMGLIKTFNTVRAKAPIANEIMPPVRINLGK